MKNYRNKITLIIFLILVCILFALIPTTVQSNKIKAEDQTESTHTTVIDDLAIDIAKTIVLIETSGNPDCASARGLSGEIGCHQFLPSTWSSYSKDVFGDVREQTPENATIVTEKKVRAWLDQGLTPREIFLIWNTGRNGKCSAGVNKFGVPFDSCAYVENALTTLDKVINN